MNTADRLGIDDGTFDIGNELLTASTLAGIEIAELWKEFKFHPSPPRSLCAWV